MKRCAKKRINPTVYASNKCKQFSKIVPELDPIGKGFQSPHEEGRIWMGCAIFCKRANSNSYYTPRFELNDLGVSPYFPDGTWCHKDGSDMNYYCMHHHCLPENFAFTKSSIKILYGLGNDVPFSQNAHPDNLPQDIKDYFSVNEYGKPERTTLELQQSFVNHEWEMKDDYVEIPELSQQFM